jgi:hypothetical protein
VRSASVARNPGINHGDVTARPNEVKANASGHTIDAQIDAF